MAAARRLRVTLLFVVLGLAPRSVGAVGPRDPDPPRQRPGEVFETANLEDPAFPSLRIRDAFRIRLESRFLPAAAFDGFDADLYKPELRLRATLPISKVAVLQLTGRFGAAFYDFDADPGVPVLGGQKPIDTLFRTGLTLQGGLRLNPGGFLLVEEEIWSVLAGASFGSRWEAGAFVDGLVGGGAFALGYELENRIRLALGFQVSSRLDRVGVRVLPVGSIKWDVTDRLTIRNRNRGVQVEYAFSRRFEVFLTAALDSDTYWLDGGRRLPGDVTLRDQNVIAGAGFEWKLSRHFRLNFEAGAVPWRELKLRSRNLGTLGRTRSDPGAYLDVRFEVRP